MSDEKTKDELLSKHFLQLLETDGPAREKLIEAGAACIKARLNEGRACCGSKKPDHSDHTEECVIGALIRESQESLKKLEEVE